MNVMYRIPAFAVFAAVVTATVPSSAASSIPVFQAEPVQSFNNALQRNPHRVVSSVRHDHAGYRAFRFLNPDMVLVGVARAVFVDSAGRVHVVQAHGEPMGGHVNKTHTEYSHILVPPGTVLPH